MLTRLTVRNFKLFDEIDLELGDRVLLIGPNNAGKTSALQALALWDVGVKRWVEKRGAGDVPEKRPGVTINRRDLLAVPVPTANLLWRGRHTQQSAPAGGTPKVFIEVTVAGIHEGREWECGLEFYYANEESLYCRSRLRTDGDGRSDVPKHAAELRLAYLPPMSGLLASEVRLDGGAINVRLGEGRTAEVLRNLCYQVHGGEKQPKAEWSRLVARMSALFGVGLDAPRYIQERGEIAMSYRTREGVELDISSSGRGQQQTLLLLAHMMANPGAVLLLDEPDAHLEVLRQQQVYEILARTSAETDCQVIAASHSEVMLREAADRDVVIAFVGRPHRMNDRGSQVLKALREIGFDQYAQAEATGWVLYVEGATDLAILLAFAQRLDHPAALHLERPFARYVGNQPPKAQEHFYALREAKPDLVGFALYDRLEQSLPPDPNLTQRMWRRREIENYVCQRATLLAYAGSEGERQQGQLLGTAWRAEVEAALGTLGKPAPWSPEIKASDDFLTPVFQKLYARLGLPNAMAKTNFHVLAAFVDPGDIDPEVVEVLDQIVEVAGRARGVDPS